MASLRISNIFGSDEFRLFLLGYNISVGTLVELNYCPSNSGLVLLTVMQKKLSLRKEDFLKLELVSAV